MPEKPWKHAQRMIARQVGGKRGISGRASDPNVFSDTLVLEVKQRMRLPCWVVEGVEKARRLAPRNRLGGMVMVGKEAGDKYIVFTLKDYLDWHGGKEATSE